MGVFALGEQLVPDHRYCAESSLTIKDGRIRACDEKALDEGLLWPDPPPQRTPAVEAGGYRWSTPPADKVVRVFRTPDEEAVMGSVDSPLRLHADGSGSPGGSGSKCRPLTAPLFNQVPSRGHARWQIRHFGSVPARVHHMSRRATWLARRRCRGLLTPMGAGGA